MPKPLDPAVCRQYRPLQQYGEPQQRSCSGHPQPLPWHAGSYAPIRRDPNYQSTTFFTHNNKGFTQQECQYICALELYVKNDKGLPLDSTTIGEIVHFRVWGVLGGSFHQDLSLICRAARGKMCYESIPVPKISQNSYPILDRNTNSNLFYQETCQ